MPTFVFDSETLPNFTLFCFKDVDTGKRFGVSRDEPGSVELMQRIVNTPEATFVGFNNKSFDNVIAAAFCAGRTELEIKNIANDLVENRLPWWEAISKYMLPHLDFDFVDLIEVAPSFVGLKAYGARMHMPVLQDMPMAHDTIVTEEQKDQIVSYCNNDVDTTEELLRQLDSELSLRVDMSKIYRVDMRSRSDTQMAEQAYIKTLSLTYRSNTPPSAVTYTPPSFIRFCDPGLTDIVERVKQAEFAVSARTGHVSLPEFLGSQTIKFGYGEYQLGVGGIHSTHDKKVCHVAGDEIVCDIDAASFYPSIILECGFVPAGLGQRFIDEYRKIYDKRLAAKKAKDTVTNETLKISLNGTFGKLGSLYSVLYAPDLMLAVTLTGQFTLLMLIEWLEMAGARTLSANTDGIAIACSKEIFPKIEEVVSKFSIRSGFVFEYTPYRVLAMKDVNNYFAVKNNRSIKTKGIYSPLCLKKNPTAGVCSNAVGQWLAHGTPMLETIKNARFVDFISARSVTGGGEQNGMYLGKVVRWYQSTDRELPCIKYVSNGNKVPKTDGARACMIINPEGGHPSDLDYQWYYLESIKIADAVGCRSYLSDDEIQLITPVKKGRSKNGKR